MLTKLNFQSFSFDYRTRPLRPTQFGGATYGGGWSRKTGKWFEVLENHGYHILRRGMGPQCKACLRNAMKDNTFRQPNCRDSATKVPSTKYWVKHWELST